MKCKICGSRIVGNRCKNCSESSFLYDDTPNAAVSVLSLFFAHILIMIASAAVGISFIGLSVIISIVFFVIGVLVGSLAIYFFIKSGISSVLCKTEGWIFVVLGIVLLLTGIFTELNILIAFGICLNLLGPALIEVADYLY